MNCYMYGENPKIVFEDIFLNILAQRNMYIFADSICRCYSAVFFFVEDKSINFVIFKSRLAPIKQPTQPQLE